MRGKGFFTGRRAHIPRIGFFPDKLFFDFYVSFPFQDLQAAGQVAVRQFEQFFQCTEFKLFIDRKSCHDPQPYPAVEYPV